MVLVDASRSCDALQHLEGRFHSADRTEDGGCCAGKECLVWVGGCQLSLQQAGHNGLTPGTRVLCSSISQRDASSANSSLLSSCIREWAPKSLILWNVYYIKEFFQWLEALKIFSSGWEGWRKGRIKQNKRKNRKCQAALLVSLILLWLQTVRREKLKSQTAFCHLFLTLSHNSNVAVY